MGTTYEPASQGTSFTDDNDVLYYAKDTTDMLSVGATPGALFASNFPEGFAYDNLAMERLPSCIMVRKIPGDISTYQVAVEAGQRRFAFTQHGNDDSLHCVYQTEKPQCIKRRSP